MKPCAFEIEGKRLNYDQMRELLLDRPDLVEIGMGVKAKPEKKAEPKPKDTPKKSKADSAIDYLQGLLDETGDVTGLNAAFYREAIKGMIAAIKAGKSVARAVKEAIDFMVGKGEDRAEVEAEFAKHRKALETKEKEVKQKALETRAATGTADDQAKEAIKKFGLDYEVESFDEAEDNADAYIEEVGLEEALEKVRKQQIVGGAAAVIYIRAIDNYSKQLEAATTEEEVARIYKEQGELNAELGERARQLGRFNSYLQRGYEKSIFGYSFEAQVEKYKKVNKGEIDEETLAKFKEYDKTIKDARKRIAELEAEQDAREEKKAEANMDEEFNRPKPLTFKQKADRLANQIRKSKLSRPSVFNSSSPAALAYDAAIEVAATTAELTGNLVDGIQAGLKALKDSDWYKAQNDAIKKDADKAFKRQVRQDANQEITVEGDKITIHRSLVKDLYLAGNKTIDKLTEAIQAEMQDEHPEISTRQIRDAITGFGKKLNPTRPEVEDQIAQQKTIGKLISQIEDAEAGLAKAKTDKEKKTISEREIELRKKLKTLTDVPVDANVSRLKAAKTRAQNKLEDLQRRITEGDFSKKKPTPLEGDTELEELKGKVAEMQTKFDRAVYEAEVRNKTKLQMAFDIFVEGANVLRALFATGELSFILIQGANFVQSNMWTAKGRAQNLLALKNMGKHFASEKRAEEWNARIKSQPWFDQAKQSGLSFSEQHAKLTVQEELYVTGAANALWEGAGLIFIKPISKKAFERFKNANPLVAFERAANGFLNTIRIEQYLNAAQQLENEGISFKDNPKAYKQVAATINTLSGRKNLGTNENVNKGLSLLFFSPKNLVSTLINATPAAFFYYGTMRAGADGMKPTVAQKIAIKALMRMTINNLSVLALVLGAKGVFGDDDEDDEDKWDVGLDPRSTSFLQVTHGKTSIDPWHGHRPWFVYQTRLMLEVLYPLLKIDAYKSAKSGQTSRLGQGLTPTLATFSTEQFTNKFSPGAGLMWDWASAHYDENGDRISKFQEPYDITAEALQRVYPMYIGTVMDLAKEEPALTTAYLSALGYIGLGINTAKEKTLTTKQEIENIAKPDKEKKTDAYEDIKSGLENGNPEKVREGVKALSKLKDPEEIRDVARKEYMKKMSDEFGRDYYVVKALVTGFPKPKTPDDVRKLREVKSKYGSKLDGYKEKFEEFAQKQIDNAILLDKISGKRYNFEKEMRQKWGK